MVAKIVLCEQFYNFIIFVVVVVADGNAVNEKVTQTLTRCKKDEIGNGYFMLECVWVLLFAHTHTNANK